MVELNGQLRSEIVACICRNFTDQQIAEALSLSKEDVREVIPAILKHYGVTDRLALQVLFVKAFGKLEGFPPDALDDCEQKLVKASKAKAAKAGEV